MKIKNIIVVIFLLIGQFCYANMGSPYIRGTVASSAFSSKDIDILSESIYIKVGKNFREAKYIVEYTISSDISGKQIPLLFYAQDYKDSFYVWIDNKKILLQNIPEEYKTFDNTPFSRFNLFNKEEDYININWEDDYPSSYCRINDLKYFEADISKGVHKIRVEYIAYPCADRSGWVKEYSYRYSLMPAKFWKSFGSLNIKIEQEGEIQHYTTNLGYSREKEIREINTWSFNKLPVESIIITCTPKQTSIVETFILINPLGITIILALILIWLHILLIKYYRKNNPDNKYSLAVILGSLIAPFLGLLSFIYSFRLIDIIIGDDAGGYHGYIYLILIIYPFVLLFYWIIMFLYDRKIKNKIISKQNNKD